MRIRWTTARTVRIRIARTRPRSPAFAPRPSRHQAERFLRRLPEALARSAVLPVGDESVAGGDELRNVGERPRLAATRVGDRSRRLVVRRGRDPLSGEAEEVRERTEVARAARLRRHEE